MSVFGERWAQIIKEARAAVPTEFECPECGMRQLRNVSDVQRNGYPVCCGRTMDALSNKTNLQ